MCQSTNSLCQEFPTTSIDSLGNYADHILEIFHSIANYSNIDFSNINETNSANLALTQIQTLLAQINNKKNILNKIHLRTN
jgi:hypothetical protein